MIFFPEKDFAGRPQDYGLRAEDVFFRTADAVTLHGWYLTAREEKAVMIFFHGNAGNISHRLFKAKGWVERGVSVFLVDYRGYGKSRGRIQGESDVYKDSQAALEWLLQTKKTAKGRIIVYGESLGSGPAVKLASEHSLLSLILEAPFTSLGDMVSIHYPFLPRSVTKDFTFDNLGRMPSVRCGLFILHGEMDAICPIGMGEKLFEAAPGPKDFFRVRKGGHNDLPEQTGEDYWERPLRFVFGNV